MAAKPVTAKLRLRLELIAALPEPTMLDRLRRLSVAELTVFRRMYGIQECRCKGQCQIQQFMLRATAVHEAREIAPACGAPGPRGAQRPFQHVPDTVPVCGMSAGDPVRSVRGAPAHVAAIGSRRRDGAPAA